MTKYKVSSSIDLKYDSNNIGETLSRGQRTAVGEFTELISRWFKLMDSYSGGSNTNKQPYEKHLEIQDEIFENMINTTADIKRGLLFQANRFGVCTKAS
jgi:hypothetical protein